MADTGSFRLFISSHIKIIEGKSGYNGVYIVATLAVCTFFVFIGFLDYYLTNLIGIAFPIFYSLKSLQSREEDDDKQWLTYWIIYSCTNILDVFSDYIMAVMPFYFFIKIVFLMWMFLPNIRGAEVIYHNLIKKYFKKYLDDVDKLYSQQPTVVSGAANSGNIGNIGSSSRKESIVTEAGSDLKKVEFSKSVILTSDKKLE